MSVKQIYAKIANRKMSLLSKYMPGRCNCVLIQNALYWRDLISVGVNSDCLQQC